MKRIITLCSVILICVTLLSCEKPANANTVVATTLPVYEITVALCKDTDIEVVQLIRENVPCLHDYTLQVDQMRTLEAAACIVINGAGFEEFLTDALPTDIPVLDSSEGIDLLCSMAEHKHNDHAHQHDPHIWLSPVNAKHMAENILAGLLKTFPQHKERITENHLALTQEFEQLCNYADKQLSNLKCRKLITFHDGFAYMAEAFGLEILHSIEEESGSEASAAELIEIINIVKSHELSVVFTEKNSSASAANIISSETGAKICQLNMAISGDSYFDAMYHNIDTLKEALG